MPVAWCHWAGLWSRPRPGISQLFLKRRVSPAGEGKVLPRTQEVGPDTRRQAPLASPVAKALRVSRKQASGPSSWTACTKSYKFSLLGLHAADSLWLPQQAPWSGPNVAAPTHTSSKLHWCLSQLCAASCLPSEGAPWHSQMARPRELVSTAGPGVWGSFPPSSSSRQAPAVPTTCRS